MNLRNKLQSLMKRERKISEQIEKLEGNKLLAALKYQKSLIVRCNRILDKVEELAPARKKTLY